MSPGRVRGQGNWQDVRFGRDVGALLGRTFVGMVLLLLSGVGIVAAQTTVDFEALTNNGYPVLNHAGFSLTGIEKVSGSNTFQYTVNGGGSLKYVTPPGALYIGYRRSAPVTSFTIADDATTFVPHALVLTNEFYLADGLQVGLRGYLDDVNTPVWTDTVTVGSAANWQQITVDLKALGAPELHRLELVPVTPAGDLYVYLESWSYVSSVDSDNDGVVDAYDDCSGTPANESVDTVGCGASQLDDDDDLVSNADDQCPGTPAGATVNGAGCAYSQLDQDNDGVSNGVDQCPNTSSGQSVDAQGCSAAQQDANGNGIADGIEAAILLIILNGSTVEDE